MVPQYSDQAQRQRTLGIRWSNA